MRERPVSVSDIQCLVVCVVLFVEISLALSTPECITYSKGPIWWWDFCSLYSPSQRMYHESFAFNCFEGRVVIDYAADRPSKDFAEVIRIAFPYFQEMTARNDFMLLVTPALPLAQHLSSDQQVWRTSSLAWPSQRVSQG